MIETHGLTKRYGSTAAVNDGARYTMVEKRCIMRLWR